MNLLKLIKCEFIKNFSLKKLLIILVVLIVSCYSLIKIGEFFNNNVYMEPFEISSFEEGYEQAQNEYKNNEDLATKGVLEIYEHLNKYKKILYDKIGDSQKDSWQRDSLSSLSYATYEYIALEQLKENYRNPFFRDWLDAHKAECEAIDFNIDDYKSKICLYYSSLKQNIDNTLEEIENKLKYSGKIIELNQKAIEEDAYYLYIESCYEEYKNSKFSTVNLNKEVYENIINNKIISSEDYRAVNARQYSTMNGWNIKIPTLEDYNSGSVTKIGSYNSTKKYYSIINKDIKNQSKIVTYAFKNNVKHDVAFNKEYSPDAYITSKSIMNQGLHLGVIIILIMAITNAGIVSREHDKGTIKLLLTKPVKRYKILLAKLLYLFLEALILWIIGSIIMFIFAGIKYGFSDLFTPKLVLLGDSIVKINYIIWYLKELFICMIPVCAILTLLFFISTVTLNTSLGASIIFIISVCSVTLWVLISNWRFTFLKFLVYTPISYIDYYFVRIHNDYYLQTIVTTSLNDYYGIFISIITIIVLYIISVIIYSKRDIKN